MVNRALAASLVVGTCALAALFGGFVGLLYLLVYAAATLPGWPIGRRLFGRHPAAWIAGGLLGYGTTALALWVPIALGQAWWLPFLASWSALTAVAWWLGAAPARDPVVSLPAWNAAATRALLLVMWMVPALVVLPYGHIGRIDDAGLRRYRAYFTADFVWHEALTAELSRFSSPPRNPYLASEPLHYYWSYFLLPATLTGTTVATDVPRRIEAFLRVNGLCSGLLFVAAIFLAAWSAVPRAAAAAWATSLAALAASAEGFYAIVDVWRRGVPLGALKGLNVDAVTSWFFQGLTIDGLPRAIWYTPQHAMACSLSLIAMVVVSRAGAAMTLGAATGAGLALALALTMSPFPAGVFTLAYGLAVMWSAIGDLRRLPRLLAIQMAPASLVGLALLWSALNETFEGAGGAIEFGVSSSAARFPLTIAALALGPILIVTAIGVGVAAARRFPLAMRPSVVAVALSAALFYGVTLALEPIWIGWRAGNIFLVSAPALAALAIAGAVDWLGRTAVAAGLAVLFVVGLPTTIVDYYNAQDTTHDAMGPGFRWTVVLSPEEQEAMQWISTHTDPDAIVQMSVGPRGRETWSLIPSFAARRMAAGRPISLLQSPLYDEAAARADSMYAADNVEEAWRMARELGIDFVYVGRAERAAFSTGLTFDARRDLFRPSFMKGDSAVYAVAPPPALVMNPDGRQ